MNCKSILFIILSTITLSIRAQETGSFTDARDKKTYQTVTIGDQIWMAENLAYNSKTACWAFNNDKKLLKSFGYMYTWEMARNVCPTGWHLPSDPEWTILTDYLGGLKGAGIKMKSTSGWGDNGNGTNETGFNGQAGGSRNGNSSFDYLGVYASWWSSTAFNTGNARFRFLYKGDDNTYRSYSSKRNALYVRCLKD